MKIKAQKLSGFRDFLPEEARLRESVITTLKEVFALYGFSPLETPAIEYAETLLGKYGEEADKLIYLFKDRGGRDVGLRYDLTVPLARVIASNPNLPMPFKRYQIQPVWRADKPQSGRYREFLQADIDIIGSASSLADADIILCVVDVAKALGFTDAFVAINDRTTFDQLGLSKDAMVIIDKIEKIGKDGVLKELERKDVKDPDKIFAAIERSEETPRLKEIFSILTASGLVKGKDFAFDRFLARGLEYYTSIIFELKSKNYKAGSLAGGGRYDNLISLFIGKDLPATGISFGIDRVIEALRETGTLLETKGASSAEVLVTVFDDKTVSSSLKVVSKLRRAGIQTEVYPDEQTKLDKQLKYADKKGIEWVIIAGPDEVKNKTVTVKNMQTGEQKTVPETSVVALITQGV